MPGFKRVMPAYKVLMARDDRGTRLIVQWENGELQACIVKNKTEYLRFMMKIAEKALRKLE